MFRFLSLSKFVRRWTRAFHSCGFRSSAMYGPVRLPWPVFRGGPPFVLLSLSSSVVAFRGGPPFVVLCLFCPVVVPTAVAGAR